MQPNEHVIGKNKLFYALRKPQEIKHQDTIVFVHGSWGGSFMWKMYIEKFVNSGWQVLTLDLRGHGRSGGNVSGAKMEDYVEDINEVIKDASLDKIAVVGHSMGGLLALMYVAKYGAGQVVAIDPSQTLEVQGESVIKDYPQEYTIFDAGLPQDPMKVMQMLPDISTETMMNMSKMLGKESGVARSQRKKGISIPKQKIKVPTFFVGGELGESTPFGIGIATAVKMAKYYDGEVVEIKGATHPGILMGEHSSVAVDKIIEWLEAN